MLPSSNLGSQEWHALIAGDAAAALGTDVTAGISDEEALQRRRQFGPNTLSAEKGEPFWKEFFEELREPLVLMLLVTGVLYAVWGELADAITIFIIILALNTVEVVNEQRSKRAIASLRKMAEPSASVLRGGRFQLIPVEAVVPGDLIVLQAGHRVPADAHLVEAVGLSVDESALTGESVPVEKDAQSIPAPATPLAERRNMVYSSTLVSRGKGKAIVVATGMETELGRIAGMARQVREPRTALQQMMDELSRVLVWFALGFSALVPLVGIFVAHQAPKQMLLTGLSLAFATIPEEMPIIITMVLSLGAFRLSRRHAIAKRLNAVESLGSVTVIATDKTGTLTENHMVVAALEPENQKGRILELGVLCNDARRNGSDFTGDPVDVALVRAAQEAGLDARDLRDKNPIQQEFTFDNARKRMSVVYRANGESRAAVKGAPESVLAQCSHQREGGTVRPLTESFRKETLERVAQIAASGLRVIAFAERTITEGPPSQEEAESSLTFAGLAGLEDPPRPEAREAIATCRRAGVRPIMITGDHPLTARAIARQVGLDGGPGEEARVLTGPELDELSDPALRDAIKKTSIYARTAPEHKLRIVQALQALDDRVAVTGDGVNDAPALAAADIGVAMGETGTDVAREAGDLVLADDNFTTIVNAVEEGRLIYENLKKGVRYYLTCKLALVLITLLPTLLLIPVPFAPVQIILMELFMDLMAAASFVGERPEADLLQQKPRDPRARFMDRAMLSSILTSSLGLFAAVSAVYLFTWYTGHNQTASQTVAFTAWLIGHVLLAWNMRSDRQPVLQLGLGSNRMMLVWAGTIALFLVLIFMIPAAQRLMKVTPLTGAQWGMIFAATLIGTFWIEARKLMTFRGH
ncbi:MAG: cation-translocating P-type ATPase [Bacteroidota bacterium]